MISLISSKLWIVTTLFVTISAFFLFFYYRFTSLKLLKSVKYMSKESIKLLNLSLAGKIGVGSISGIALSIFIGGKGTIFWIWVSSIILSIYTYLETKAGFVFRENNGICGPFVYIKNIMNNKLLSVIYTLLIVFLFLFSFILIQSNTIIISINNNYFINKEIILTILLIVVFISINKDVKRISNIVSFLVPIMGFIYLIVGIIVIINNFNIISTIIVDIIKDGLRFRSFISIPFVVGFQRAIFSNESGMGSTSMIVSLSKSNDYKQEYFFQALGMFYISLVICTISALIILTSNYETLNISNINGIEIINYAFNYHFPKIGNILSITIITLFAFSTIITSYYYGSIAIKYLFHNKNNTITKIIVIIVIVLSAFINPINIWGIVDITTALITLINVYSLLKIRKVLKDGDNDDR